MNIIIVVDANVILSALLGGKSGIILFDSRFEFITSDFTLEEVRKYFPTLAQKLGVSEKELRTLLYGLPVKSYSKSFYKNKIKEAERIMKNIDSKDVEILALALKFEAHLWSQDKHFDACGYKKILKTHQFL